MIRVTAHAVRRYRERVEPCSNNDARARILEHSRAIEAAAGFGCEVVRCARGERLVLSGETVVTVYAPHTLPRQLRPHYVPHAAEVL